MTHDLTLKTLLAMLGEAVADAVEARLADRLTVQRDSSRDLLDEPAMAARAGVSAQSLARRRKAGQVPFVQCGRRVLYAPQAVLDALAGGSAAACDDEPEHIADILAHSPLIGRDVDA